LICKLVGEILLGIDKQGERSSLFVRSLLSNKEVPIEQPNGNTGKASPAGNCETSELSYSPLTLEELEAFRRLVLKQVRMSKMRKSKPSAVSIPSTEAVEQSAVMLVK